MLLFSLAWILLVYFEQISATLYVKIIFNNLQYIPIALLPYFWFLLGFECKNAEKELPRVSKYLWIPCIITIMLVWADQRLGLVRQSLSLTEAFGLFLIEAEHGPWFRVHLLYSLGLILLGSVQIVQSIKRYRNIYGLLTLVAIFMPLLIALLYIGGVWPESFPELTPVSFVWSVFLMILSRYRFLYTINHSRSLIIEDIQNAVLILDSKQGLIFANTYAREVFRITHAMINQNIASLDSVLSTIDISLALQESIRIQLYDSVTKRHFEYHYFPIQLNFVRSGTAIIFYDITERNDEERMLKQKNSALAELIRQRTNELSEKNKKLSLELERRKVVEEKLVYDAVHDPLTGLGTRSLFFDNLQRASGTYQRDKHNDYCILYLDFDEFKDINDNYGHSVGDLFLIEIAKRLKEDMRDIDLVCRIGGDEFVILLTSVQSIEGTKPIIQRIQDTIIRPIILQGHRFIPSVSIGVSFASIEPDRDPNTLLKNADIAMYRAKAEGKNCWVIYDESMKKQVMQENQIAVELETAIEEKMIYPMFQPIVDIGGAIVGWEALPCWEHGELGTIPPEEFIRAAENSGQIIPLGDLMLGKTLEVASRLFANNPDNKLYLSINVFATQLRALNFRQNLLGLMRKYKLSPAILRLKMTDNVYSSDITGFTEIIDELQKQDGIFFSLDALGALNLPLAYIDHMPFLTIKIDRLVTQKMGHSPGKNTLLQGIISLIKILEKQILVAGVETDGQAQELWTMGADFCQGEYFGEPVDEKGLKRAFDKIRMGA